MEEPINNYYYRDKMYGLYYRKLIHSEISLKDVPEWLLEDTHFGKILYKTALDPDGCDFKKHYSANMEALENGIKRAQQNGNVELLSVLQEIQEAYVFWEEQKHSPKTDRLLLFFGIVFFIWGVVCLIFLITTVRRIISA